MLLFLFLVRTLLYHTYTSLANTFLRISLVEVSYQISIGALDLLLER